jgi:hypothetical protein
MPYLRLRSHRRLLFAGLLLIFPPCAGQVSLSVRTAADSLYRHISREKNAGLSCYFTYARGSSVIAPDMGNNAAELEKLDAFITQALSYPDLSISHIRLTGYCSVEGSSARNQVLSYERVEGFYHYLREHYPGLYRYPYDRAWAGEDWAGLSERVKTSRIGEREEVLEIIRRVRSYDAREALLAKLNGGRPWLFMEREIFPQLRRVELRIEYGEQQKAEAPKASPRPSPKERGKDHAASRQAPAASPQKASPHERAASPQKASPPKASPQPSPKERGKDAEWSSPPQYFVSSKKKDSLRKKDAAWSSPLSFGEGRGEAFGSRAVSLKTNLLLWSGVQSDFSYTAPVANVALEYFITPNWSVEAGAAYSYWHYNSNKEFQGVSGYRLEPRYRLAFPGDRFGAYLGLYGRVGDYDCRTIDREQGTTDGDAQATLNYTGNYWDAGVSGGFTLRLVGNLGLEIGVRGGYVATSPDKYTYNNGQKRWESRWKYSKVGVTDVNLSLIYNLH